MARTPFVSGNWKMFTNAQSGKVLAAAVAAGLKDDQVEWIRIPVASGVDEHSPFSARWVVRIDQERAALLKRELVALV